MSILTSKIFYVNGENRIEGTPSNFSYAIDVPDGSNFDSVCVLATTIPKSFWLIRDGYNTFRMTVNNTTHELTIEPGNYNANSFVTAVLALTTPIAPLTMTYVPTQGKYRYETTEPITWEFYSPLALQFGFAEFSTNVVGGVSPNVVDFVGPSTIFLHSDMVDDSTSIMQEVYAGNVMPYQNIVYQCNFPGMYTKKLSRKGGTFKFSLTDEHLNPLDLNGHNVVITILVYRKENLSKLLQQIFPPAAR